jgi:hypothetical protein
MSGMGVTHEYIWEYGLASATLMCKCSTQSAYTVHTMNDEGFACVLVLIFLVLRQ